MLSKNTKSGKMKAINIKVAPRERPKADNLDKKLTDKTDTFSLPELKQKPKIHCSIAVHHILPEQRPYGVPLVDEDGVLVTKQASLGNQSNQELHRRSVERDLKIEDTSSQGNSEKSCIVAPTSPQSRTSIPRIKKMSTASPASSQLSRNARDVASRNRSAESANSSIIGSGVKNSIDRSR